ncbi:uncharacterized protein LOC122039085 [Zingiber officinale]|uniref:uncharacterized protein LOC122039085 n=1 Tax=Zingiber officinale TaxID=94328 RepID=UPI001C4DD1CC|nr:uncharacterized protein LOC122039085 [Zingiber officinale]
MDIPSTTLEILVSAFSQGLTKGNFFHSLILKPPKDFDRLLWKASEYVNVEEVQGARKKEAIPEPTDAPECRVAQTHQPPKGPQAGATQPFQEPQAHAVQHLEVERSEAAKENRSNATRDNIGMIVGDPTDGDSNMARKLYAPRLEIHAIGCSMQKAKGPEISFGPRDLVGVEVPHDDALIIRAVIANYNIHQNFIDINSLVNIIFKKAFDQLQIDRSDLQPMMTPLYGFTSNEVLLISQAQLAISLREESLRRIRTTNFIMVDVLSAYNIILGRLALNEFWAIVSTFCQKIKFLVDKSVGEVNGDQLAAQWCYIKMVKSKAKAT